MAKAMVNRSEIEKELIALAKKNGVKFTSDSLKLAVDFVIQKLESSQGAK